MSTHLGNASHPMLHKTQNYIWTQLANERLTASFIVDGIHLPGKDGPGRHFDIRAARLDETEVIATWGRVNGW